MSETQSKKPGNVVQLVPQAGSRAATGQGPSGGQGRGAPPPKPPPRPPPSEAPPHEDRDDPGTPCDSPFGVEPYRQTDVGNATRLIHRFGKNIRWCAVMPHNGVLVWDGNRWTSDSKSTITAYTHAVARDLVDEVATMRGELARLQAMAAGSIPTPPALALTLKSSIGALEGRIKVAAKWAEQSEMSTRLKAMAEQALHQVAINFDELDADPMLLNTARGLVDLRAGELRAPVREDLITKIAGAKANHAAKCPTWIAFLTKIMGGDADPAGAAEMVGFLQRVIGYCLTGCTTEQCMFILHGAGSNGKSTFLDVIREVFGEYAMHARAQTFMQSQQTGGIPNDVAAFRGARLITSSEPKQGEPLDESLIKEMTGDAALTARFMRAEFFTFEPTFKVFLATNHLPKITGTDHGIWRRIRLIPFTVTIADDEKDPNLKKKLLAERDGILRWAVQGCGEWLNGDAATGAPPGLRPPDRVVQATKQYRNDMDVLADFLSERCVLGDGRTTTNSDLYNAFKAWCIDNGVNGGRPKSHKWLTVQMKAKKFQTDGRKDRAPRWEGIEVIEREPPPFGSGFGRGMRGEA